MVILRAAVLAVLFHVLGAAALLAQDVTLTSRDGTVEVTGSLVGYDGEFYRVETVYGVLTLDGSGVVCTGSGCPDLTKHVVDVRLSGSASPGEILIPELIKAFAVHNNYQLSQTEVQPNRIEIVLSDAENSHNVVRFQIHLTDSNEGFADLLAEEADIAVSSREALEGEIALGQAAGIGNISARKQSRVLAMDALAPIVSPRNPVQEIPLGTLFRVLAGEVTNWQELGGLDAEIELQLPESRLGMSQVIENYLGVSDLKLAPKYTQHSTTNALRNAVQTNPFALGITLYSSGKAENQLIITGQCGFIVPATRQSLKTEDYPLNAPVFIYISNRRLPAIAREFLRFILSPAAQSTIKYAGFVGREFLEIPIGSQGDRLKNAIKSAGEEVALVDLQLLVDGLNGARRLALSFRFSDGSATLDAQSKSNVLSFSRAIETGLFDGRELIFSGFSDGVGPAAGNKRLSERRAASVREAIVKEAVTADFSKLEMSILGFGEAMPLACDDTEWGRRINRRVEVWVR